MQTTLASPAQLNIMKTIYTDAPEVRDIASKAFPSYTGRKFAVAPHSGAMRLDSYWDGGSRSYYVVIDIATGRNIPIPENGTPFSNNGQIFTIETLPANVAIVEHRFFLGKDHGITIYVSPDSLNRFALPAPVALTIGQQIVLAYTRSRKSSYNGQNRQQMALAESAMPQAEWDKSKAECITNGWLNKSGAVTDAGKNLIGWTRPEELKFVA